MKQFVTLVAFSVSSLLGTASQINATPLEAISEAETVKVYFDANADESFLSRVKVALALRNIKLDYQNLAFDESGKLKSISFKASSAGDTHAETTVEVNEHQGAYLYISFS